MTRDFNFIDDEFITLLREKYSVILVDIDGVLLTPEQYLCSSLWYTQFIKSTSSINYAIHHYCNQYEFCTTNIKPWLPENDYAVNLATDLYHCMSSTDFVPVNQLLINILTELSQTSLVLGLTGRTYEFHNNTAFWLNYHGMTFTNHSLVIEDYPTSRLESGIIYVGHDPSTALPYDKGEILSLFLNKMGINPQKILFIDDFKKNLANVEKFCQAKNIEFVGVHYTEYECYLNDTYTRDQITMIGTAQYHHFFRSDEKILLSNQAALEYCQEQEITCLGYSYSNHSWLGDWPV